MQLMNSRPFWPWKLLTLSLKSFLFFCYLQNGVIVRYQRRCAGMFKDCENHYIHVAPRKNILIRKLAHDSTIMHINQYNANRCTFIRLYECMIPAIALCMFFLL